MRLVEAEPGMLLSREEKLPDSWVKVMKVEPDRVWTQSYLGKLGFEITLGPGSESWDQDDWFEVLVDHTGLYPTVTRRHGSFMQWPIDTPLEEAIGEALGAASMCWSTIDQAGTFDSVRAAKIADALLQFCRRKQVPDE